MTSVAARLALISALAASAGCTLVSGWNDLQGGARSTPDAGRPASVDSGTDSAVGQVPPASDAGTPGDSAAGDAAAAVITTVACGSARCPQGQGCCASILGQSSTCQTSAQSCSPPSTFETCSDSAPCTASLGHAAQCCASSAGIPSVSCRTTCAAGDQVVCDPTLVSPGCLAGMTCQIAQGFGYNTCQ